VFDHVTIRVADRAASERFYRTVFAPLGIEPTYAGDELLEWDDFSLSSADAEHPPTRGLHAGFVAPARAIADEFSTPTGTTSRS
jgi:catechol 2,3-dioxygenase-like lactoylglutathione lyase family enzyme